MSAVLLVLAVAATLGCLACADRRLNRRQEERSAGRGDAQGAHTPPPSPMPGPEAADTPQRPAVDVLELWWNLPAHTPDHERTDT